MMQSSFRSLSFIAVFIGILSVPDVSRVDAQNKELSLTIDQQRILKSLKDDGLSAALQQLTHEDLQLLQNTDPFASHLSSVAGGLNRSLAQLSSDEQYELLESWTMGEKNLEGQVGANEPTQLRILTALTSQTAPPMEFARALGERPQARSFPIASVGDVSGLFSSAWILAMAADDSGNLSGLIAKLESLSGKTPQASFLLTLLQIRDTRVPDERIREFLTTRIKTPETNTELTAAQDAVLVAAALQREGLRGDCVQLAERLNQFDATKTPRATAAFLRRLRALAILKNQAPDEEGEKVLLELPSLWIRTSDLRHQNAASGSDHALWLTHEHHMLRLAGPGDDLLLFRYPLAGAFEFRSEVTSLDTGEAGLTYGGLRFQANTSQLSAGDVMRPPQEVRKWPFVAAADIRLFNRVGFRSDGESMQFLSNLHPGWKITLTSAANAPWLGLAATGSGKVYFRNLEFIGEPVIPREVRLADHAALPGWVSVYGERLPNLVQPLAVASNAASPQTAPQTNAGRSAEADWSEKDGVMIGRRLPGFIDFAEDNSQLTYIRPLLEGETLEFEFYHEPGGADPVGVNPTLGPLAFLIEPTGVRLRWITTETDWTGLEPENAIIESVNRRGPRILPLGSSSWNHVSISRNADVLQITLNQELVYERPTTDLTSFHPGFYHNRRQTEARIRNVVLKGNWPEKLDSSQLRDPLSN